MQDWNDTVVVQELLYQLDKDNVEEAAKTISQLEISKSLLGVFRLVHSIALFANANANTKRINLFVELIKTLESMNSDENCLNDLSTLIIRYLFNYSKCALKNGFDVFLANMIENKLVTIEDINGEINYLKKNYPYFHRKLAALLPYAKEANEYMFRSFVEISAISKYKKELPKLDTDIDSWKDFAVHGTFPNTPERYIQEDDVDSLGQLFTVSFDVPGVSIKDLVILSCKYGSVKCFKYFIMNNLVTYNFDYMLENLGNFAIEGGNFEIIHIVQNTFSKELADDTNVIIAADNFRHEVLLWLLNSYSSKIDRIYYRCAEIGNMLSFKALMERYNLFNLSKIDSLEYYIFAKQNDLECNGININEIKNLLE